MVKSYAWVQLEVELRSERATRAKELNKYKERFSPSYVDSDAIKFREAYDVSFGIGRYSRRFLFQSLLVSSIIFGWKSGSKDHSTLDRLSALFDRAAGTTAVMKIAMPKAGENRSF